MSQQEKGPVAPTTEPENPITNDGNVTQFIAECQSSSPITTAGEANAAHRRIVGSVQDAIAIGEFLTAKKADDLSYNTWKGWVEENLEFDQRTAWNYMHLYKNRHLLETVSSLSAAYKLLAAPVKEEEPKPRTPKPAKVKPEPVTVEAEVVSQENLPAIDVAAPETTVIANVVSKHDKKSILVIPQQRFENLIRGVIRPLIQEMCQQAGPKHAPTMRGAVLNVLGQIMRDIQQEEVA